MVAEAFHGPRPAGLLALHADDDPDLNAVDDVVPNINVPNINLPNINPGHVGRPGRGR